MVVSREKIIQIEDEPAECRILRYCKFNLLAYKKRDYRHHKVKESWFIITNLDDPNEVIKLYKKRAGIEALQ